jgi:hypothetical protein
VQPAPNTYGNLLERHERRMGGNEMTMHDLFSGVDDPVTEASRMLSKHDLFVVPGSVVRECMNVLHILLCDTESVDEAMEIQALIHNIEAAFNHGMQNETV